MIKLYITQALIILGFCSFELRAQQKILSFSLSPVAAMSFSQILLYFPELGSSPVKASEEEIYSLKNADCQAQLEQPARVDPPQMSTEQSLIQCHLQFEDGSHKELQFSLKQDKVDFWGNTYNNGVESTGKKTEALVKVLKHLHFLSPKETDLSTICDPNFNYCIESYGVASQLGTEPSFEPISCSVSTELSREAIDAFKFKNMSRAEQYEFLQKPDQPGWIERQLKAGVRTLLKSSCRYAGN